MLLSLVRQRHLPATDNPPWAGLYYALDEFDEKNKGDLAIWKHKADDDEQFLIDYNYKLGTFYKERMKICNDYYLRQLKACIVKDEHQRNRLSSIISICVDRSLAIDYFKKAIQLGKECKIDKSDVISNSCWELADRDLFPNLGVKEERSFLMALSIVVPPMPESNMPIFMLYIIL